MKKLLSLFAGVALLLAPGCATTNQDTASIVTTLVVYNAAYQVLLKNPDQRPKFVEAHAAVLSASETGTINAATLLAAIKQIPLGKNEELKPAITSAAVLVTSYLNAPATPEAQARLKATAKAVGDGLNLAIIDTQ